MPAEDSNDAQWLCFPVESLNTRRNPSLSMAPCLYRTPAVLKILIKRNARIYELPTLSGTLFSS